MKLKAIIKRILPGGLVIHLDDGRKGFVPKKELSWENVRVNPFEKFSEGDTIEVVKLKVDHSEDRFSVKRALKDPWEAHVESYRNSLKSGNPLILKGIVYNVREYRVYVELTDHNTAVINPANIPVEENRPIDLTRFFHSGDWVSGRLKDIDYTEKRVGLDIKGYAEELALERRKRKISNYNGLWKITIGDIAPELADCLSQGSETKTETKNRYDNINVLAIEDALQDREKLNKILDELNCTYQSPASYPIVLSLLNAHKFTIVFVDKNLTNWEDAPKFKELAEKIYAVAPEIKMVLVSAEDEISSQEVAEGIDVFDILKKPLIKEEIEHNLKRIQTDVQELSVQKMKEFAKEERLKRDFILNVQNIAQGLEVILKTICDNDGVKGSAVFQMDMVGREVDCISSYNLQNIRWENYKSNLRFTPIEDIILGDEPVEMLRMPPARKRNFPGELEFVSFAGIPIPVFNEVRHGLIIFGLSEGSISPEAYLRAQQSVLLISNLLERAQIEKIAAEEAYYSSIGRLHIAMGHEIRDALTGIETIPKKLREKLHKTDPKHIDLQKMADDLKLMEKTGGRIQNLFDFYRDLTNEDVLNNTVNIKHLFEKVVDEAKSSKKAWNVPENTFFEIIADASLSLNTSEIKLRQVLKNLVLNACQQMKEYGPLCPYILLKAFEDNTNFHLPIKLVISDSGPGVTTKVWDKIFEPWYSTQKKGAGFGLNICKFLTRLIGGRIRVFESYRYIGTTFIIELPKDYNHGNARHQ